MYIYIGYILTNIPEAECGTDQNLLISIVKIKFKHNKEIILLQNMI